MDIIFTDPPVFMRILKLCKKKQNTRKMYTEYDIRFVKGDGKHNADKLSILFSTVFSTFGTAQ